MAKINILKKNEKTIYPGTIPQAVVDPETGISLKDSSLNCYSCGSGSKFKLCRLNISETRGVFKFTIISDVNFLGEYIIAWYTTTVNIYCLYATTSQMVAAAKLVKIDDNTYDIYCDAGANGEVSFTILGVSNYLIIEDIFISSVSEIPTVYKSSEYAGIYGKFRGNADTATDVTNLHVATTSKIGGVKSGPDIAVDGDGSVTVNNRIIPKIINMGINTAYKLFSINSMGDKGNIIFSIVSPVLYGGAGYATYMVFRTYQGSGKEKNCYPVCLYATEPSMHNRIKLVRTGNESFDVYYQSTGGNDYCNFVLVGQSGIDITIITTGTSSIPEDIYKESYYYPLHFGDIYGSLKGNADTATKATQDGNGKNIADTYLPKTGGTMSGALTVESNVFLKSSGTTRYLQIATVNNSGVAFTSRVYVDVNAGRGAFLQFINKGVAYELGVFTDGGPRYIKDNTIYMLYHTGNLVNATTSKAGLMSAEDKKRLDSAAYTDLRNCANLNWEALTDENIYPGAVLRVTYDGNHHVVFQSTDDELLTAFSEATSGYFKRVYIFDGNSLCPLLNVYNDNDFYSIKFLGSDEYIHTVDFLYTVNMDITNQKAFKLSEQIEFNNSSDAINIDNYPQNDYGTITIWYNDAQADRSYSPGTEGVIYQTKYRSQTGDSVNPYVDCLTQLYVGSGGIKQRTVIDYDIANPFDGIPWS